jgi:very-short-patch-repair endonuclease
MVYKKRSIERIMFYGAKADTFQYACELRKNMTEAERVLWESLKKNNFKEFRFKAQHPIKTFIADFYCHKAKLVIEVDGGIHDCEENKEYDENRSYEFEELGLKIIRFTNEDVLNNTDFVIEQISKQLIIKEN